MRLNYIKGFFDIVVYANWAFIGFNVIVVKIKAFQCVFNVIEKAIVRKIKLWILWIGNIVNVKL